MFFAEWPTWKSTCSCHGQCMVNSAHRLTNTPRPEQPCPIPVKCQDRPGGVMAAVHRGDDPLLHLHFTGHPAVFNYPLQCPTSDCNAGTGNITLPTLQLSCHKLMLMSYESPCQEGGREGLEVWTRVVLGRGNHRRVQFKYSENNCTIVINIFSGIL